MKLTKIQAGEYRTTDGEWMVVREDVPSLGEWDEAPVEVTWYAITTREWKNGGALPDSAFEATTRRAVVEWLETRPPTRENKELTQQG